MKWLQAIQDFESLVYIKERTFFSLLFRWKWITTFINPSFECNLRLLFTFIYMCKMLSTVPFGCRSAERCIYQFCCFSHWKMWLKGALNRLSINRKRICQHIKRTVSILDPPHGWINCQTSKEGTREIKKNSRQPNVLRCCWCSCNVWPPPQYFVENIVFRRKLQNI